MEEPIKRRVEDFFAQFKHQKYRKGEVLIRADGEPLGIFFLKEGIVKQYSISKKGEEIVVNIFKPYTFFPMTWAVNKTPNRYYFEAVKESETWLAPSEEVVNFVKNDPEVLFDLLRRVYLGLDGLLSRMVQLMSEGAYERLINEMLIHTKRFGTKNSGGSFEVRVLEAELAAESGLTRETVSREIKKLKQKNLIEFDRNLLRIKDLNLLEEELM
jgi:CRP-like cAMP-binding protein